MVGNREGRGREGQDVKELGGMEREGRARLGYLSTGPRVPSYAIANKVAYNK